MIKERDILYKTTVKWTGNTGSGTTDYKAYERSHLISVEGKKDIEGSSDWRFRGDKTKHDPEDLLLAAVSSCHMLWYLHLCADNGIIVTGYTDNAEAVMSLNENGSGKFTKILLNPAVTITDGGKIKKAEELHKEAGKFCFIANSLNINIEYNPQIKIQN